ncbi:protein FAM169B-like [Venturia canescens]|uniref:protein FAM169B-like n=1 Tax=Venturia canescens TaxID=32260 RepID=UPI001C9D4A20|nr:protein FAM169B-like [Venturia canescens]
MFCSRCLDCVPVTKKWLDLERINVLGNIARLDCNVCRNFIGILQNGEIINVDKRLDGIANDGWKKVRTDREKICYYVLSQIIYPEVDTPSNERLESLYDFADDFDEIILRWENGRPVAFYTIKTKDTEIHTTGIEYSMPTIDTAYVRSEYRNRGIGTEILLDVISRFPIDDIAFSKPISNGMLRVLKRFLTERKDYRLRFWEMENGDESSQKLVWFLLRNSK